MKLKIIAILFIALLSFVLISSWFYWFQWMPFQIRKSCMKVVYSKIEKRKKQVQNLPNTTVNAWYRMCLSEHGMKPESIVIGD